MLASVGISRRRVSVCLSHASIVLKLLNVESHTQCHVMARGLYRFLTPTVVGGRRPIFPEICAQSDPQRMIG